MKLTRTTEPQSLVQGSNTRNLEPVPRHSGPLTYRKFCSDGPSSVEPISFKLVLFKPVLLYPSDTCCMEQSYLSSFSVPSSSSGAWSDPTRTTLLVLDGSEQNHPAGAGPGQFCKDTDSREGLLQVVRLDTAYIVRRCGVQGVHQQVERRAELKQNQPSEPEP